MRNFGILDKAIQDTPVAVIDVETTGLSAERDRIVEISIVRIEPGKPPQLCLDTLVNPGRPVAATRIHGITDADVFDAPGFSDIAGEIIRGLSGCALAAYNVYFDAKFLLAELQRVEVGLLPPHFCIMLLRTMLGHGGRCSLREACNTAGVNTGTSHSSASDALAASHLYQMSARTLQERGIETFNDLANRLTYKFVESFAFPTVCPACAIGFTATPLLKPRPVILAREKELSENLTHGESLRQYMDALKAVLADCVVTEAEIQHLATMQRELGLSEKNIQTLLGEVHEVFSNNIPGEGNPLQFKHCLARLGFAPPAKVESLAPGRKQPLKNRSVVVTGMLLHFTRAAAEEAIKSAGGRATSSVSKNTDFVVVGESPGSKADKARLLGVEMIDEAEFERRLKG